MENASISNLWLSLRKEIGETLEAVTSWQKNLKGLIAVLAKNC
jgi:hypothetical protein